MITEFTKLDISTEPVVALKPVHRTRTLNSLSVQIEKACFYLCRQNKPNFYCEVELHGQGINTITSTASRVVRYYIPTFVRLTMSEPLNIRLTYIIEPDKTFKIMAEAVLNASKLGGFLRA